jgi:alpha-L-fucosidase
MIGKTGLMTVLAVCIISSAQAVEKYEANWDSLRQHQNPEWALDAKFGIYAHWGPFTQTGAWTDNPNINWGNYYITSYQGIYSPDANKARRKTFEKRYGSITDGAGYKDLCADFKADAFDPGAWADLIKRSGARYAGICAIHHDGYAMWDSDVTEHCAGKTGTKRDLLGEMMAAIKARGIKTIATFHHARTYKHFSGLKQGLAKAGIEGVDILDPKNEDYYWFLGTEERFAENRKALTFEVIEKYKPDVLWFDGGGGKFGTEDILAVYFNMGIEQGKEVCVHNKGNFGTNFGIYSYENGAHRPGFVDWPWEDDTPSAVGWCDWPWWYGIEYKKPRDVVVRLADLVARNGGLLLSMNPRPDGSFDQGQIDLLEGIGKWLAQNGQAIYGTRPWIIHAEGHVEPIFFEEVHPSTGNKARPIQPDTSKFDATDIRFTTRDNTLYAIQLDLPTSGKTIIKSLGKGTKVSSVNKIKSIELFGHGEVKFKRIAGELEIKLPKKLPNDWALAFKITVEGELQKRKLEGKNKVIPMQT